MPNSDRALRSRLQQSLNIARWIERCDRIFLLTTLNLSEARLGKRDGDNDRTILGFIR
ncbi:hypothetical protein HC931_01375 [Candidatus Gracilibacteria bacterium]|nr:hypothetical protein [Candidatus Gracilibacteria bacterium]